MILHLGVNDGVLYSHGFCRCLKSFHRRRINVTNSVHSVSFEQAENSSRDSRALVVKSLDNNEKLARRLTTMQRQESTSRPSRADIFSFDWDYQERMSRTGLDIDKGDRTLFETPDFGCTFDKDSGATRVYRLARANSLSCFPSSKGQSRGWSYHFNISLSQVLIISAMSLSVNAAEIFDGGHYIVDIIPERPKRDKAREPEQYEHPWLSIIRDVGCP